MALDPQARAVLDQMAEAGGPPINELSVNEARQASAALAAMQGVPEPVGSVEDRMLLGPGAASRSESMRHPARDPSRCCYTSTAADG